MTQVELNRAVAHLTGETVDRVVRIGFSEIQVPRRIYWPQFYRRWQRIRKLRLARRAAQKANMVLTAA